MFCAELLKSTHQISSGESMEPLTEEGRSFWFGEQREGKSACGTQFFEKEEGRKNCDPRGCSLFFWLFCCFLWRNTSLAGGFAGRRVLVVLCVFWLFYFDLPAYMDQLCPCTNVFSTAYAHVRTEPKRDIGQTRGKNANPRGCRPTEPGRRCFVWIGSVVWKSNESWGGREKPSWTISAIAKQPLNRIIRKRSPRCVVMAITKGFKWSNVKLPTGRCVRVGGRRTCSCETKFCETHDDVEKSMMYIKRNRKDSLGSIWCGSGHKDCKCCR